jgi:hypothetical protein
MFALVGIFSMI